MNPQQQPYAKALGVCLDCGRAYARRAAKPRWAFTRDGRAVGSVHTYHENVEGRAYPYWTADGDQSLEAARFAVWRHHVQGIPRRDPKATALMFALTLGDGHEGTSYELSAAQEARLEEWLANWEGATGHVPPNREAVLAAWRHVVHLYQGWRARVPPDSEDVRAMLGAEAPAQEALA